MVRIFHKFLDFTTNFHFNNASIIDEIGLIGLSIGLSNWLTKSTNSIAINATIWLNICKQKNKIYGKGLIKSWKVIKCHGADIEMHGLESCPIYGYPQKENFPVTLNETSISSFLHKRLKVRSMLNLTL